jgi:16S rRNA (uracil1498-N3)-methyltransferase
VSAPLFLVPADRLATAQPGTTVLVDGPEGRHASDVMRLRPGEPVLLGDGAGTLATGEVLAARKGQLEVRVSAVEHAAPPEPRFTLVQALAKGDRDLLAVEVATELGIDEVVPWQAERSVSRWRGDREERSRRRWEQTLLAATKQARRATVPALAPPADRQAVVDRIARADLALVLHEEASEPLAGLDVPQTGDVVLVVGPEGGISPAETEAFVAAGGRAVRLGSTVLRTSTAGSAALAVLLAATRWR